MVIDNTWINDIPLTENQYIEGAKMEVLRNISLVLGLMSVLFVGILGWELWKYPDPDHPRYRGQSLVMGEPTPNPSKEQIQFLCVLWVFVGIACLAVFIFTKNPPN